MSVKWALKALAFYSDQAETHIVSELTATHGSGSLGLHKVIFPAPVLCLSRPVTVIADQGQSLTYWTHNISRQEPWFMFTKL